MALNVLTSLSRLGNMTRLGVWEKTHSLKELQFELGIGLIKLGVLLVTAVGDEHIDVYGIAIWKVTESALWALYAPQNFYWYISKLTHAT